MFTHSLLIAIVLCIFYAVPTSADDDLVEMVKNIEVFRIRSSALGCPIAVVGQSCPAENPLYYFKCCGDLNASCCFRLQIQGRAGKITTMSRAIFYCLTFCYFVTLIVCEERKKPLCEMCENLVDTVDDALRKGDDIAENVKFIIDKLKDHESAEQICSDLYFCYNRS
uniref:Saposin B-type domain-containing protein n=1 Tax=Heterorhabditis bacteriophora TaxID=37862 RepID=A0A1I7WP02_HETBA